MSPSHSSSLTFLDYMLIRLMLHRDIVTHMDTLSNSLKQTENPYNYTATFTVGCHHVRRHMMTCTRQATAKGKSC